MITQKGLHWDAENYQSQATLQRDIGLEAIKRLNIKKTDHILDIGCGDGSLSIVLAKKAPLGRIIACDISEEMAHKTAETLEQHRIHYGEAICENAVHLNYQQEFDVIFSNMMAHWVPNQHKFYKILCKSLKPGGRMMLSVFVEWRDVDPVTMEDLPEELDDETKDLCCPWQIATSIFYDILIS
jgi:trans-aconitate 2-methyltransferase